MKNELPLEFADLPVVEVDSDPESQEFFGGRSESFYVTVSNLKIPYGGDCDESDRDESVWVGAVDIGELTCEQYADLKTLFYATYRGGYDIGFRCQRLLPEQEKRRMKVVEGNKDSLTKSQKEALDIALRIADQIRNAEKKAEGSTRSRKLRSPKGKTVPEKVAALICREPEKADLSAERLAKMLKCSASAIKGTPTWNSIMNARRKPPTISYEDPSQIPERSKMDDDQN